MYELFQSACARDRWTRAASNVTPFVSDTELLDFFQWVGGAFFRDGLYRVIHPGDSARWHERVLLAFLILRRAPPALDTIGREGPSRSPQNGPKRENRALSCLSRE